MKSWIKAVTWRFLATGITLLAAYIYTGEIDLTLKIGLLEATLKIVLYVLHDKVWNKIMVEAE